MYMGKLCDGERPSIPEDCPTMISRIMKYCWLENAEKRCPFSAVIELLKKVPVHTQRNDNIL